MINSRSLLGAMLSSGMGGRNPRMGGGGLAGALGGMLGGSSGRGHGMGGLSRRTHTGGMGGMQGALLGVLGGIAASALQRRMQHSSSSPHEAGPTAAHGETTRLRAGAAAADVTQAGSSVGAEQSADVDEGRAQLLVRVMVAAANADMQIDQDERRRILDKVGEAGADPEAREFVEREMRSPMSIDEIAREVSGPDVAAQVYAAALAAIDVDKAMERRFLQALADRTGLDQEIVGEIHDQLGQPRPQPAG